MSKTVVNEPHRELKAKECILHTLQIFVFKEDIQMILLPGLSY
jgi:hypothetical protein